ncbi:MAG: DUF2875 family protein [Pseudomonadota bacterium]
MSNRLLWWVAGPVALVALVFAARWNGTSDQARAKAQPAKTAQKQQLAAPDQSKQQYVLEVIGLGVTLDKYRQGKLWEALQVGSPFVTIREQDKEKYEWSQMERAGISGGRAGDALENGAQCTPMYFGVPVFNAQGPSYDPENMDLPNDPMLGLAGSAISSGMAWHLFVAGPRRFAEHPDRILEDVFAFFDSNPDVPYVVLNSNDDMYFRDLFRTPGTPALMKNGKYIPEMPDSSALFVLARRERVDPVRPFVWDDPTFVTFIDPDGKPVTRRDERDKLMRAGWQAALLTLPEAARAQAPALIVAATGGDTDQTIMLSATLDAYAAHGGQPVDRADARRFIDTDKRLGDTGAATWFMQMAIGVMGSYRMGGVSAALNLRDKNEASIVFISAPSDSQRATQQHPRGGDVFAHRGAPAIDPANYQH